MAAGVVAAAGGVAAAAAAARRKAQHIARTAGLVMVIAAACSSTVVVPEGPSGSTSSSGSSGCVPGTQMACACLGGDEGIEDCNAAGTAFGPCECSSPGSSSAVSSSAVSSSAASSSSGAMGGAGGASSACQCTDPAVETPPYCGASQCAACAGHIYYAGMFPNAPAVWANLSNAGGLTALDAGDAQCKALGVGADHVCDLTEVQAANAHQEPLFVAVPAGTTAWMLRTTPVYVEGLSGTPCVAAAAGETDSSLDCATDCHAGGKACGAGSDCCSGTCTAAGTCTMGSGAPCVCAISEPGRGGDCNNFQLEAFFLTDGEYIVFGASGVPTAPGLPAHPGDPGFHYDNDTIFDPNVAGISVHDSPDFSCDGGATRAILCCYASCM